MKTAILCLSLIVTSLMLVMQSQAKIDPKNIVGIWFFDEGRGDTAKDISENGNHAKLVGAKWTDGKWGKALNLMAPTTLKSPPAKVQMTIWMGLPIAFG